MSRNLSTVFDVWKLLKDDDQWDLCLSTSDFKEAVRFAKEIGIGEVISTIYELGRVNDDGVEYTDQIMFWWSKNGDIEFGGSPEKRGRGYAEKTGEWVSYDPTNTELVEINNLNNKQASSISRTSYRMRSCTECGLEAPQNELHHITREIEAGRSSGTYRVSASRSKSYSSEGSSTTSSRYGASRTSGRHFYKNVNLLLCSKCYGKLIREEKRLEKEDIETTMFFYKIILWVSLFLFIAVPMVFFGLTRR